MGILRPTFVSFNLGLFPFDGIEKYSCSEKICAAAWRHLQVQQLAIKERQSLLSDLRSCASSLLHRQCVFLCGNKSICSSPVQQACVVQTGDDAQQRVEAGHVL